MEKQKSIQELAKGIKDDRFLALFSAFIKALDSKDYKIMKKLTLLRDIIIKFNKLHFKYGIGFIYKLVYRVLKERDYFYWERKLLKEYIK